MAEGDSIAVRLGGESLASSSMSSSGSNINNNAPPQMAPQTAAVPAASSLPVSSSAAIVAKPKPSGDSNAANSNGNKNTAVDENGEKKPSPSRAIAPNSVVDLTEDSETETRSAIIKTKCSGIAPSNTNAPKDMDLVVVAREMQRFENSTPSAALDHALQNLPNPVYNAVLKTVVYRFIPTKKPDPDPGSSTSLGKKYMGLLRSASKRLASDPSLLAGLKCSYCAGMPQHFEGCVSFVRLDAPDAPELVANAIHQRIFHMETKCKFARQEHGEHEVRKLFDSSYNRLDVHLREFCKEWLKEWNLHKERPLVTETITKGRTLATTGTTTGTTTAASAATAEARTAPEPLPPPIPAIQPRPILPRAPAAQQHPAAVVAARRLAIQHQQILQQLTLKQQQQQHQQQRQLAISRGQLMMQQQRERERQIMIKNHQLILQQQQQRLMQQQQQQQQQKERQKQQYLLQQQNQWKQIQQKVQQHKQQRQQPQLQPKPQQQPQPQPKPQQQQRQSPPKPQPKPIPPKPKPPKFHNYFRRKRIPFEELAKVHEDLWEEGSWALFNPLWEPYDDADEADEYLRSQSTSAATNVSQQQQPQRNADPNGNEYNVMRSLPPPKPNPEYCLPIQPHQLAQCPDGVPYAKEKKLLDPASSEMIGLSLLGILPNDVVVAGEGCSSTVARSLHDRIGNRHFFGLVSEHRHQFRHSCDGGDDDEEEKERSIIVETILDQITERRGRFFSAGSPMKEPRRVTEKEARNYVRYRLERGFPDVLDPDRHDPRCLSVERGSLPTSGTRPDSESAANDVDGKDDVPPAPRSKVWNVEHAPKIGLITGALEWDTRKHRTVASTTQKLFFSDLRTAPLTTPDPSSPPSPSSPSPNGESSGTEMEASSPTTVSETNANKNIHGNLNGIGTGTEAAESNANNNIHDNLNGIGTGTEAAESNANNNIHDNLNGIGTGTEAAESNANKSIQGKLNGTRTEAAGVLASASTTTAIAMATPQERNTNNNVHGNLNGTSNIDRSSKTTAPSSPPKASPTKLSESINGSNVRGNLNETERDTKPSEATNQHKTQLNGDAGTTAAAAAAAAARGYEKQSPKDGNKRNNDETSSSSTEGHTTSPRLSKRARSEDTEVIEISSDCSSD